MDSDMNGDARSSFIPDRDIARGMRIGIRRGKRIGRMLGRRALRGYRRRGR